MKRWQVISSLLCLGLQTAGEATELGWDFPRSSAVNRFVFTMTPEGGSPQQRTAAMQTCRGNPGEVEDGWQTYCAPVPCTMQGMFNVTVRAETAEHTSPESAPLRLGCLGDAGQCSCTSELTVPDDTAPPTDTAADVPRAEPPPPLPSQRSQPVVTAVRPYQGELVVLFRHPRAVASLPTRFLLSYTSPALASRLLYAVPLHDVTACQQLIGTEPQTWCTRLGCPGSGPWTFDIRAEYPEAWGPVSPSFACTIAADAPDCACQESSSIPVAERVAASAQPPPRATEPPIPSPPPAPAPAPPSSSATTNLVRSPSPTHPWQSGSFAGTQTQIGIDTTVQRQGHAVQKLTGRGNYFAQTTSEPFSVEPDRTYTVSAWVKLQGITQLVEVDIFYWDKDGNQLHAWGEAIGGRLKGTRDWTRLAGQVTIPTAAVRAVIQLRVMSRMGIAWVDDVQMHPTQEDTHATR